MGRSNLFFPRSCNCRADNVFRKSDDIAPLPLHISRVMRHLLATLALIGLLLSPAAASAAAMRCVHEHAEMGASMHASEAAVDMTGAAHDCCDEDMQSSARDGEACAQDCIVMNGVSVALSNAPGFWILRSARATMGLGAEDDIHPFAPPGLKRPPKKIS